MKTMKGQSKIDFKVKKSSRLISKLEYVTEQGKSISPTKKSIDKAECVTPSSVLSSLSLSSPAVCTGLSDARKALHASDGNLPCRESELKKLHEFIFGNLTQSTSASMYVSGLPGTGKTACLLQIIEDEKVMKTCHIVLINCTAVKSSGAIYVRICEALKIKLTVRSEKCALAAIQKYLARKHKPVLLILDEIDQLESKFQSVLYTIFEWPSIAKSKLLLIGIANAVDLTDRLLPRLSALVKHKPTLLHFKPYTKDEICAILKHRLSQTGGCEIFAPGALELISAKVAGQSGDVRRALDLGRRVLEVSRGPHENVRRSPRKHTSPEFTSLSKSKRALNFSTEQESNITIEESHRSSPRVCRSYSASRDKLTPKKKLFGEDVENITSPRKREVIFQSNALDCSPSKRSKNADLGPETSRKVEVIKVPRRRSLLESFSTVENNEQVELMSDSKRETTRTPIKGTPKKADKENAESPQLTPDIKRDKLRTPKKKTPVKPEMVDALRRSPRKVGRQGETNYSVHARDVLNVVNQMFGTAKNLTGQQPAFPIHQKLLICSLLLVISKGRRKDVTVGRLHEVYSRVCSRRGLTAVDQSGFFSLCRQVEMAGAVALGKGPARLAKIHLQWDEAEVAHAVQDSSLLAMTLNDTASLSGK